MKILQVCSASEMGGGEVHVADLVRALVERGHSVHMAVRPESPLKAALSGEILSWHELPLRNSLDVKSARMLAELIEQKQIDIVHAHVGRDYLVTAMACREAEFPNLVLTRHHYLPVSGNPIYRWLLRDVGAFIAVSTSVADSLRQRLALSEERVLIIPNWIDPTRYDPRVREEARSRFRIKSTLAAVCIGKLTPAKGHEDFVRAAARVASLRSDVQFLVVGNEEPDKHFGSYLMELAASLGLQDRITFTGFVKDIPAVLAAADVVVVPSWDEGFSLVTIEALASRRAVVASDTGGIRDIVEDNVNGLLFQPRNVDSLTSKMLWLLSDASLRERLASRGQRDAEIRFGRDPVVDQIEQLYTDLMNRSG